MANEDLIGFKYITAEGTPAAEEVEVIESCPWSDSYVTVRFPSGHETIKQALAVRQRKQYEERENSVGHFGEG